MWEYTYITNMYKRHIWTQIFILTEDRAERNSDAAYQVQLFKRRQMMALHRHRPRQGEIQGVGNQSQSSPPAPVAIGGPRHSMVCICNTSGTVFPQNPFLSLHTFDYMAVGKNIITRRQSDNIVAKMNKSIRLAVTPKPAN